jgi:hypothetical protein
VLHHGRRDRATWVTAAPAAAPVATPVGAAISAALVGLGPPLGCHHAAGKRLPARLVVFFTLGAVVGVYGLARGLGAVGEPDVVWTVLGGLALAGALMPVAGWLPESRRG